MRVGFRADASLTIGTGHVMRCLTLADELRMRGADCVFLSRDLPGNLHQTVRSRGYKVRNLGLPDWYALPEAEADYSRWLGVAVGRDVSDTKSHLQSAALDWLVVDHYGLDGVWEKEVGPFCGHLMTIDDLANRSHVADVLLDQNLGRTEGDYAVLVPPACRQLIGPSYALLRPEFAALRQESLARRPGIEARRILVTMGGVDRGNVTGAVLHALGALPLPQELEIVVVLGEHSPWKEDVRKRARRLRSRVEVVVNASHMGKLMCEADLAIGAAGSTSWERCCLGLPSLVIVLAENQRKIADSLCQAGAAVQLDVARLEVGLAASISRLVEDPRGLENMSHAAAGIVDGRGAGRVADYLYSGRLQ